MEFPVSRDESIGGTLNPSFGSDDIPVAIAIHIIHVNGTASIFSEVDFPPAVLSAIQPKPRGPVTATDYIKMTVHVHIADGSVVHPIAMCSDNVFVPLTALERRFCRKRVFKPHHIAGILSV